jgi:VIT1/CCC1 family predicted Fe2+/Mn2+ transporter
MARGLDPTTWTNVREWFWDAATHRSWAIDANDGIIATAGILQGFAGAGAGDRLLLFTATAATIAGGLSVGGAKWAEDAAERDAQVLLAAQEQQDLATDPHSEIDELAHHYEERGLSADLAHEVAHQLSAHDALSAQLDWEYGFDEPMPAAVPILSGVTTALAYVIGALIPLLITYFAPVAIETWAILTAVVIALAFTSIISARTGHLSPRKMLVRSLIVGGATMLISYIAGELLL